MSSSGSQKHPTEDDPLLLLEQQQQQHTKRDSVVATSTKTPALKPTVHALLESGKEDEVEKGMVFMRRVFALLVLQYMTILLVASPFTFIKSVQENIHPYHNWLEAVAVIGIVGSLGLAVLKGTTYPFARVALVCLTLFVALELGLSFASASWGKCGIVAVGQATTSFAVILAIFQFETRSLAWLTYPTAAVVMLVVSCMWMVVLIETGLSLVVSVSIGLGGWVFALMNLFCCHHITKQVAPDEYTLATLFILVPEALVCLASKKRHPKEEEARQHGASFESPES